MTDDFVSGGKPHAGKLARRLRTGCLPALILLLSPILPAQVLSPPPRLEPTAIALEEVRQCGKDIEHKASKVSQQILDAHDKLYLGLLKGGYVNNAAGSGYGRDSGYEHEGDWLLVPPPKEYVADLSHEARWCLEVAHILNTDPAKKDAAEKVLASIAEDLRIKAEDCRVWGAGRLITVVASTLKNGQPDPGWTVMYKWVSVSGLNALELSFPQVSTPTSTSVPPGVYSVYAQKQVGAELKKTTPMNVSAYHNQKVKCEIPVP